MSLRAPPPAPRGFEEFPMVFHKRFLAALAAAVLSFMLPAFSTLAESPASYDMSSPDALLPEHLYAQSALLVDMDTGETLFSKNSRVRMYPASTTKIMTLLLGLESGISMDDEVTIPQEAADIAQGSSVIPVLPGDVMRFDDLLYSFMLSSGNDGANAVAVLTDGSIDAFVAHMNARAAALGMEGTHYANAHGYHDAEHYTTAQDLAILSREAMRNPDFRNIVATPKWTFTLRRGGKEETLNILSRNSLLQSDQKYYYPDCTGIKTGHHNKAGWCFVGSAQRSGRSVLCVVLKCEQENDKWYDAARLFEYGFTRYEDVTAQALLTRAADRFSRVQLQNAEAQDPEGGSLALNIGFIQGGEQTVPVVQGSALSLQSAVDRLAGGVDIAWQRPLEAPVEAGEQLGLLTCTLPNGGTVTASLTASRAVMAQSAAETPAPQPAEATDAPQAAATDGAVPGNAPRPGGNGAFIVIAVLSLLLLISIAALICVRHLRRHRRRRRRARALKSLR